MMPAMSVSENSTNRVRRNSQAMAGVWILISPARQGPRTTTMERRASCRGGDACLNSRQTGLDKLPRHRRAAIALQHGAAPGLAKRQRAVRVEQQLLDRLCQRSGAVRLADQAASGVLDDLRERRGAW